MGAGGTGGGDGGHRLHRLRQLLSIPDDFGIAGRSDSAGTDHELV